MNTNDYDTAPDRGILGDDNVPTSNTLAGKIVEPTDCIRDVMEPGCGKLAENVTQPVCRDLLADALVRLEAAGHSTVLQVHDEVAVEVDDPSALDDITSIICQPPTWAADLPIAAKGFICVRYRK